MIAERRFALLAALLFALGLPCWADGVSISVGVGGGLAFGFGGELLKEQNSQQLPLGGLRFSGSYGWAAGSGTLELGAATGFSASGASTLIPLALTLGYSIPLMESLAITAGIRGGAAMIVKTGKNFLFEPIVGPRLELVTYDREQTWGFYFGIGTDFFLEEKGVGALFMAEFGFKSFIGE